MGEVDHLELRAVDGQPGVAPAGDGCASTPATCTTRDGRQVVVRPVRPDDEPRLDELFAGCSEPTVHSRFLGYLRRVPQRWLAEFAAADGQDHVGLVGVAPEGAAEAIVAEARYYLDPATGYANCGFLVRDDWQGRGLGRCLVRHLVQVAGRCGVVGMTADVLVGNRGMLHLLSSYAPGPLQKQEEGDVVHLSFPLSREDAADLRPEPVRTPVHGALPP